MYLKKAYNYSFLGIATFPLFSIKTATKFIALWVLFSILILLKEKSWRSVRKTDIMSIFILSTFYLVLLGNYFFSGFDASVLKFLETDALFIVFPLFIFINREYFGKEMLQRSLVVFFLSNTILAIVCWARVYSIGYMELAAGNNFYKPTFRNLFSDISGIHLPYLGLLFTFSIFIGIFWVRKTKGKVYLKAIVMLVCLVLLISIATFSARMSLVSFLGISIYILLSILKGVRQKVSGITIIVLLGALIVLKTPIKTRIDGALDNFSLPSLAQNDTPHKVNLRYGIYYCTIQNIKENFFFGIGKQNSQDKLQACYNTFTYSGVNDFTKVTYNSHNQYLDVFLAYGFFGFLIITVSFFSGFFTRPGLLYSVFLLLIAMALLTENIFDRQVGVMFYTLFNTLFFLNQKRIHN